MFRSFVVFCLGLGALSGCAGGPALVGGPGLQITGDQALPPPDHIDPASGERPYRLGPLDKIQIAVFGQEELSREEVVIDASGTVALPMIGQVRAGGLTPAELSEAVTQRLRAAHVRDPHVAVNLVEARSQVVTVDGAVEQPGLYPVMGHMTLMRAVATAKGTSEFARLSEVVVFRTVGDQRMAALYSLQAIRAGRYEDPEIFAGDVVVVGDSPGRRLFRDIAAMGGLLTAPLVAVLRP